MIFLIMWSLLYLKHDLQMYKMDEKNDYLMFNFMAMIMKCQYRIQIDIRYTDFSAQWFLICVIVWKLTFPWHIRELQTSPLTLPFLAARPPPLDLRGLSTITECPTHLPLSRAMTESWWEKRASLSTKCNCKLLCFGYVTVILFRSHENSDFTLKF